MMLKWMAEIFKKGNGKILLDRRAQSGIIAKGSHVTVSPCDSHLRQIKKGARNVLAVRVRKLQVFADQQCDFLISQRMVLAPVHKLTGQLQVFGVIGGSQPRVLQREGLVPIFRTEARNRVGVGVPRVQNVVVKMH